MKNYSPGGRSRWLAAAAATLFLVYATNFLYFFVDDEGIPFVYAQNVLHGHGLAYNAADGRLEGYSDFLHVGLSTLVLSGVRHAGLPKISVFFIGKSLSLLSGLMLVTLTAWILRRAAVRREHWAGDAMALGFLALAGPLAVWSCSSLETVPFALLLLLLVAGLATESDRLAALAAGLLILERIDGFVPAGIVVAAFLVTANAARRRQLLAHVALPVCVLFAAYHGWRAIYFRDFVPAPLEAKIFYKLTPRAALMVKARDESYLLAFVGVYGWPAAVAFVAATAHVLRVGGTARAVALATIPLVLYVSLVGDWMFGFRFFVPLLPLMAITLGLSVQRLNVTRPRTAVVVAVLGVLYAGGTALRFVTAYTKAEAVPSFLARPSRDLHIFFWPYYGLYETARTLIPPAASVADNQAGFVPFMLDVNNIDDLGICSRFYAELPGTDGYFTEVGRYAPLTDRPTVRVQQAYLLYRDARFILARTDILRRANGGRIRPTCSAATIDLVATDAYRQNAIYRRSDRPTGPFASDPASFTENLAHISYLHRAIVDGAAVAPGDYADRLPFLHDDASEFHFTGRYVLDLQLARTDESVREITVRDVRTSHPSVLRIRLSSLTGRLVNESTFALGADRPQGVAIELPPGTKAGRLVFELSADDEPDVRGRIDDLRVSGQTPALAAYVAAHLPFPAAAAQLR